MVAPVFREPAFVWACVAPMGGCALAALVWMSRKPLLGLMEQFLLLSPFQKTFAVLTVSFVALWAGANQKDVSSNQHESARNSTNRNP